MCKMYCCLNTELFLPLTLSGSVSFSSLCITSEVIAMFHKGISDARSPFLAMTGVQKTTTSDPKNLCCQAVLAEADVNAFENIFFCLNSFHINYSTSKKK